MLYILLEFTLGAIMLGQAVLLAIQGNFIPSWQFAFMASFAFVLGVKMLLDL